MPKVKSAAARRPARSKSATKGPRSIEVTGELGRREAEAIRIEILGLAQRYGIRLKAVRVEVAAQP